LLVDGLRRVIHDHCAVLVVDLGIHARVANQVDNPFLPLVRVEAKAGGQVPTELDQKCQRSSRQLT
jgi:hypothetical protein